MAKVKRINNLKRMQTVKDEQIGLCRYVKIKYAVTKRINGKWRHIGEKEENGLQVENKVYLTDGSYKMINSRGTRIMNVLNFEPDWATESMKKEFSKYNS